MELYKSWEFIILKGGVAMIQLFNISNSYVDLLRKCDAKIKDRCCNFPLLEEKMREYEKRDMETFR